MQYLVTAWDNENTCTFPKRFDVMDNNLNKRKKLAEDYSRFTRYLGLVLLFYFFRKLVKCWKRQYEILKK